MRSRKWMPGGVLIALLGLPGAGIAKVRDAPSLEGVIDIHAHAGPETSALNFKSQFDSLEAAQITIVTTPKYS